MDPAGVAQQLQRLGGFASVELHDADLVPPWLPLSAALDGSALRPRVEATGRALGPSVQPRVAASVAQLGLAARLVTPVVAAAVLGARLQPAGAHWQDVLGGPVPLSLPPDALEPATTDELEAHLVAVVEGPLRALARAVTGAYAVPEQTAAGNTASALAGAAAVVPGAQRWVLAGLGASSLAGTWEARGGRFRRRSCCGVWQAAGGRVHPAALCGDCVLA
ncbi:hypothetical protein EV189_1870 [Motilibacter rhizosphaerae]|uniref:FhuF-like iron-sulfur protein n=1 Tax=Motilibacter rhizosphaerae TaxID=598652 RepID=A0A4Q7NSK9_9ACTN|nr:hypothetical protein [Motilibacter rhizosphaerae]RZS90087.1 hypothetical protein EV189_1870 [Motilibacter rhizosphaerae]